MVTVLFIDVNKQDWDYIQIDEKDPQSMAKTIGCKYIDWDVCTAENIQFRVIMDDSAFTSKDSIVSAVDMNGGVRAAGNIIVARSGGAEDDYNIIDLEPGDRDLLSDRIGSFVSAYTKGKAAICFDY